MYRKVSQSYIHTHPPSLSGGLLIPMKSKEILLIITNQGRGRKMLKLGRRLNCETVFKKRAGEFPSWRSG